MICKGCGKNIPDESTFCPYCMTKFTQEQRIDNKSEKSNSNTVAIAIIVVAIILVIAVVATVVCIELFKKPDSEETVGNVTATTTDTSLQSQNSSELADGEAGSTDADSSENGTTTTTQDMNNDKAIRNAYVKQMMETLNLVRYYIYDMNNDGVYELIITDGTYEGDFKHHFYTYRDGKIEYIDEDSARYSSLYVPLTGKGILNVFYRQETLGITEIIWNGKTFSEEKLLDTEIGYDEDYWEYVNDYASEKLVGCEQYDPQYAEYIFELGYEQGSQKWASENPTEY